MHPSKLPSQTHLNNVFPSYMQNSDEYLRHPGIGSTGRKKKKKDDTRPAHPTPASVIILKMLPKQIVLAAVARQQPHCSILPGHVESGAVASAPGLQERKNSRDGEREGRRLKVRVRQGRLLGPSSQFQALRVTFVLCSIT